MDVLEKRISNELWSEACWGRLAVFGRFGIARSEEEVMELCVWAATTDEFDCGERSFVES